MKASPIFGLDNSSLHKELINKFSDTTLEFSVQGIEMRVAVKSTVR